MLSGTPIDSFARALCSALLVDLPQVKIIRGNGREILRQPGYSDVEAFHFPQTWPDTSLGFGGIGGSAITTAYTTVVYCAGNKSASVYFDGRFAYKVVAPEAQFFIDLKNREMAEVSKYVSRYQPNMPF